MRAQYPHFAVDNKALSGRCLLLIAVTTETRTDGSGSGDYRLQIDTEFGGSGTDLLLSNGRVLRYLPGGV